jgi:hypothetical protein
MGPLGAKLYPARRWAAFQDYPRVTAEYGGKGKCWVFGALEPQTGKVLTQTASRRSRVEFIAFLDAVVSGWQAGELILIMDNLSVHKTLEVRLWALAHERVRFLFQPTYAPWLNLIEPWWKTLRAYALRGRTFGSVEQLMEAIHTATDYWNAHRHPYRWLKAA